MQTCTLYPYYKAALVKLQGNNGKLLMAASQNKSDLKVFELKGKVSFITLQPTDVSAVFKYKSRTATRHEFYYGSSFYRNRADLLISIKMW